MEVYLACSQGGGMIYWIFIESKALREPVVIETDVINRHVAGGNDGPDVKMISWHVESSS